MRKTILIASILLAGVTWLNAETGFAKTEPRDAAMLLSQIAAKAKIPPSLTNDLSRAKELVQEWYTAAKNGKTKESFAFTPKPKVELPAGVPHGGKPTGAFSWIETELGYHFTSSRVEQALGKPDRITNETIPFLLSSKGEYLKGKVLWYSDVGFCFTLFGEKEGPLAQLLYSPK